MKDIKDKQKIYAYWAVLISGTLIGLILMSFYAIELFKPNGWVVDIYKNHFLACIGLPLVALLSLIIVIIFNIQESDMKVSLLGFNFEGSSSKILMWVIVFLVQTLSLKLLW
jgi:hypothetical protein